MDPAVKLAPGGVQTDEWHGETWPRRLTHAQLRPEFGGQ